MSYVLLLDDDPVHAERVVSGLSSRDVRIQLVSTVSDAAAYLRRASRIYDLLIVNVSNPCEPWITHLARLQHACRESGAGWEPLVLCTSRLHHGPKFELEVERKGARYVVER